MVNANNDVSVNPAAPPTSGWQAWLSWAEVDRALAYALLMRAWQILAAPITLLAIARCLSPEAQGYYYTFTSLLALQSLVELGFSAVVTSMASHEWADLALDADGRIVGTPAARSRLVSLGRLIFLWYAAVSGVFVAGVGCAGYVFFAGAEPVAFDWQSPWLALVALSGLLLWMLPFTALLEGCSQVATINRFQMTQAIVSNLALWLALVCGAGLWAGAVAAWVSVLRDLWLLGVHYRHFFAPFWRPPEGARMDWYTEIWPMQARLAGSGVFGYLAFALFTPVMFHYHGPVVAGQMGMTWMLVMVLPVVATAWLQTKVPRFGMLIAKREYAALDRLFLRVATLSVAVSALGALALWCAVAGLYLVEHPFAQRLLPPLPTGVFLLAIAVMQISLCETAYLRAHRREPLLVLNIVFGLTAGLSVWLLGARFGPLGAALGFLAAVVLAVVWETAIWFRCRRAWHQPS
jgi:O-antigen/teichoic acid export membrane protein